MDDQNKQSNFASTNQPAQTPPSQPLTPEVVSPKKSFFSGKLLLLLIAILILILAGGGTYLALALKSKPQPAPIVSKITPTSTPTPTPDPTASWKTYTNTKYGYSLKYPPSIFTGEANIKEEVNGDVAFDYFKLPLSEKGPYPHSINISEDPIGSTTIDDYVKQIRAGDGELPKLTREKILIGGKDAEKILGVPSANGQMLILVPLNGKLLAIVLNPYHVSETSKVEADWVNDFNLLLSTIKFTDANQAIDTSTWKTYTNTKVGYSLLYPNGWTIKQPNDTTTEFYPPGAELFNESSKNTPGNGSIPAFFVELIDKPFNKKDDDIQSSTNQKDLVINGVTGKYYNVLRVPVSGINFDLPVYDSTKTLRFIFPVTLEYNFSTFNPNHMPNVAKFDEETFKTFISTIKFTQ